MGPSIPPVLGGDVGRTFRFRGFALTESTHAGGVRLGWHTHPHPGGSFVIRGAYRERLGGDDHLCRRGGWLLKPAGAPHTNHYDDSGARCLHVQFIAGERPELDPLLHHAVGPGGPCRRAEPLGRRLARELMLNDATTPVALEALLLEFAVLLSRSVAGGAHPAHWVDAARDYLEAHFREAIRFQDLAGELGADPVRLSEAFRRRFGCSPGTYLRRRRLEWTAERLRDSTVPIGRIGLEAGFHDHSHFTRVFRRLRGMTPETYRRTRGTGDTRRG